jgi:ATP-binding cassette, subfamily C, bacterial PrsD
MARPGQKIKPATAELKRLGGAFSGVAVFSGCINILMLTGSIYMLQVYDRVLSSRSVPTLIGISAIVLVAFIVQGVLDSIRSRMLARIGAEFDQTLTPKVFDLMRVLPLRGVRSDQASQGVRDLDTVRGFLGSLGPTAFFDMPFMPLFFVGCFLLHPLLGVMALVGGLIIIGLTLWTERKTQQGTLAITQSGAERFMLAEASRRNAEAVQTMGMGKVFRDRWLEVNRRHVDATLTVANASSGIGAAAKVFRMAFQSAVLGVGAYLVIIQQMTPGAMIAASILTSRALAPIETAVAHWKSFVASRQSLARLNDLLAFYTDQKGKTLLPVPLKHVVAEDLAAGVPGRQIPLLVGANITLKAGSALLVMGQSGSGKSTLVRVLSGVWPAMRGSVRIDGAALDQWSDEQLGNHMGYMPQDVELFDGTVSQNIGRFLPDATDAEIVESAKAAGAHGMILKLSEGYDTRIGEGGATLSAGQRQRVGLARALFRNPFLLILDEPNSNLDAEGEMALASAIKGTRQRGGIAIIVSHKTSLVQAVDFVGLVQDGRFKMISSEEYRQNVNRASPPVQAGPVQSAPNRTGAGMTVSAAPAAQQGVRQQVAMLRAAAGAGAPASSPFKKDDDQ